MSATNTKSVSILSSSKDTMNDGLNSIDNSIFQSHPDLEIVNQINHLNLNSKQNYSILDQNNWKKSQPSSIKPGVESFDSNSFIHFPPPPLSPYGHFHPANIPIHQHHLHQFQYQYPPPPLTPPDFQTFAELNHHHHHQLPPLPPHYSSHLPPTVWQQQHEPIRKNRYRKSKHQIDNFKYSNCKIDDFKTELFQLSIDQYGCRYLQRELDKEENDHVVNMIFDEVQLKIVDLMIDPFGNYMAQKLFEFINEEQRLKIIRNLSGDFLRISIDPHGTRALQKLIDCVHTTTEEQMIVTHLKQNVVSLSKDANGNHVIQKTLQKLASGDIFQIILDNVSTIASHKHGCCVIQRCFDYGSSEQIEQLSKSISMITIELALDPFGNYVIQYIIQNHEKIECIESMINEIIERFLTLSMHKFGSNVIEKCLKTPKYSMSMIERLLSIRDNQVYKDLLNDSYGNYVLQTSLDVCDESQLKKLASVLLPLLQEIKSTPHGKRILSKIQK